MKISINLNERQMHYLKKFSEKQYSGADDNLCTHKPIHVVENERYFFMDNYNDYEDSKRIIIVDDEAEYTSINELLTYFNISATKYNDDEYDIDELEQLILKYKEKNNLEFDFKILYKIGYYQPTAFFWIREEAERYLVYQKHNLTNPRVYTYSPGYSNCGEYEPFFDLLMSIGNQINDE